MKDLVVTDKLDWVYHFHKNTLHAANELWQQLEKPVFRILIFPFSCVEMNLQIYPTYISQTISLN